ncbi:hypothetical protein D081_2231 [Anaerovibrio sp. JC8]|nr:hypothetical protein D081_2231 [Anaerovibrio sp. JC8]
MGTLEHQPPSFYNPLADWLGIRAAVVHLLKAHVTSVG